MCKPFLSATTAVLLFLSVFSSGTIAKASGSPTWQADGIPVCTATGDQFAPCSVPDGKGGAILAWIDLRDSPVCKIYTQRINGYGEALWGAGGIAICNNAGTYSERASMLDICPDENGGAIVVWSDSRSGPDNWEAYAQRVDASGTSRWAVDGVRVSTYGSNKRRPLIVTDGNGGGIIAWEDERDAPVYGMHQYCQRLDSNGALLWGGAGIALNATSGDQTEADMTSDEKGGAAIVWKQTLPAESITQIYAQRLDGNGAAQWLSGGLRICGIARQQAHPCLASDRTGGVIVAWEEQAPTSEWNIYAARVGGLGSVMWGGDSIRLPFVSGNQSAPKIIRNDFGGAIIGWSGRDSGGTSICLKEVISNGNTFGTETIATVSGKLGDYLLAEDGDGGATVVWECTRADSGTDICAQRIDDLYGRQWGSNGILVCGAAGTRKLVSIVSPANSSVIAAWQDNRSGSLDIYAQRIGDWDGKSAGLPKSFYFAEGYTGSSTFQEYLVILNPNPVPTMAHITYMFLDGTTRTDQIPIDPTSRVTIDVNEAVGADKELSMHVTADDPILAERPMYFNYSGEWSGGHTVVGATSASTSFYFAEGYTAANTFAEYLTIMNPNPGPTTVHITYMFNDGSTKMEDARLGATSRTTINVNASVGPDKEVSIKLTADDPIVAERPMYFNYNGEWSGGHDVIGATSPSTSFYFAEGYTGNNTFAEYLTLMNPNPYSTTAHITYMYKDGSTRADDIEMGGTTRATVNVNAAVGPDRELSVRVTSDDPILVERPMYFNYQGYLTGGHDVIGASSPSTCFYFVEGRTGHSEFSEYLTLMNPNPEPTVAHVTYMLDDASAKTQDILIAATSRATIDVNAIIEYGQLSMKVTADDPIVAERPMYFEYISPWTGGYVVMGFAP